jgi:hypothetical protein
MERRGNMQIVTLYRYERAEGGITVSPTKPQSEYTELYRLIADEDKALTQDGENLFGVIDTESTNGWYEVELPETEEISDEKALLIITEGE